MRPVTYKLMIGYFCRSPKINVTVFYPDAELLLVPNMPKPRGCSVNIRTYVDADHAGNVATKRSQTETFIYLNNLLIIWFSRWQNTVNLQVLDPRF